MSAWGDSWGSAWGDSWGAIAESSVGGSKGKSPAPVFDDLEIIGLVMLLAKTGLLDDE